MKKTIATAFAALLLATSLGARATVLDFEDLTLGTSYGPASSFVTSGVTVNTRPFVFSSGVVFPGNFTRVGNIGFAGGSGNELQVNNINLDFLFGGPIPGLDLMFGEYGGNLNLNVNGDFRNFQDFQDINGANIGGVNVGVINGFGNDIGLLSLSGNINSFAIGGQELWIDNVSIVPVPAAVWLFASALVGLFGFNRRRKVA